MSRAAEHLVWERSRAKGSNLLVLLKLADCANDEGMDAFPSPQKLATWTRMSDRGLRHILHKLERDGEIVIEPNEDGRALLIGKRRFRPAWFIHLRCVCDWALYEADGDSANFSSSPFKRGRPKAAEPSANLAESPSAENGQVGTKNGNPASENRKKPVLHIRKDLLRDPVLKQEQATEQGASRPTPVSDPADSLSVITRLVHDTVDALGVPRVGEYADFADLVKGRCAELRIPYDSTVIRKAIESAMVQRTRVRALERADATRQ